VHKEHNLVIFLQSGGRLAGVKREIKTETTGSFAYNFSVLKKVLEEPNFSVNRTALQSNVVHFLMLYVFLQGKIIVRYKKINLEST
jgi:hypothetical protein